MTIAIIFFMGAHFLLPRIADASKSDHAATSNSTTTKINYQIWQLAPLQSQFHNEFQPPNYGGPDSEYGSGTR
ncbi:hypothetical protein [Calothrix sp. UHCC 0171]|uniref:hypothetical protein n=1 Tax=Calothrix sp. UHCC 0171 TaxID=3110245 RepID=UPI002B21FCAF|nr:hypothetical protein [Calothrix sp. UHCC 0171]MEA5573161.1 hypothetical protein [Calothrix sp. UHCC 0171]